MQIGFYDWLQFEYIFSNKERNIIGLSHEKFSNIVKKSTGKDIKHIVYGNALQDIVILERIIRIEPEEVVAELLDELLKHIERLHLGILKNRAIYRKRYLILNSCKKIVKDIQCREYNAITWSPMSWITSVSPLLVSIFYFILVSINDVRGKLYNISYRYFETDSLTDKFNGIGTSFSVLNMGGGFFYYFFISLFLGWIIGNIIQNFIRGRVLIVPLYLYVDLGLKPINKTLGKIRSFICLFFTGLIKVRALQFCLRKFLKAYVALVHVQLFLYVRRKIKRLINFIIYPTYAVGANILKFISSKIYAVCINYNKIVIILFLLYVIPFSLIYTLIGSAFFENDYKKYYIKTHLQYCNVLYNKESMEQIMVDVSSPGSYYAWTESGTVYVTPNSRVMLPQRIVGGDLEEYNQKLKKLCKEYHPTKF